MNGNGTDGITEKSGITQDEVIGWGGPEVFNQALRLANSGDILEFAYDPLTLKISGRILLPSGTAMPTSLTLKRDKCIESHCPCAANQQFGRICPHVVALGIAVMASEMDEGETDGDAERKGDGRDADDGSHDGAEEAFIEVPARPRFSAFISGSRAALSLELDAHYGDRIEFPACSVQSPKTVFLPDADDPLVRRVRSLPAEREAVESLAPYGFEPGYREGDLKLYLTGPQKVLDFLGAGFPELRRRGWHVDLSERLSALYDTFRTIVPVVKVRDAPDGAFDIAYEFDAMGTDVSPVEIQAALNRGDGYLLKDDSVYMLDNVVVSKMHDVFRDCATTQGGAAPGWFRVQGVYGPYVKRALDALSESVELEADRAEHWRRQVEQYDPGAKFEPVALGPLDRVLRPYQKQGVYWMRFLETAGFSGLLADEMGLGKTLQTLTWLTLARESGRSALIVCPTSLVRNWEAEAAKFTPGLKTLVLSGPDRHRSFPRISAVDLVITSYALLQRDFDEAYAGREFSALVIDEAQHIKNRQTKNALAVKGVSARRRLALTGTPVENSVSDVWSIFDFLMPGYLGDYETFKCGYEDPISAGGAAAEEAQERLKRKLGAFILRRLKKSVAKDLPDKIVKVSYCPLADDAQREYLAALAETRRLAGDTIREQGFAKSRFAILALLMKLRQIASRGKLAAFLEVLASAIEGGHKILVFSQFVRMLAVLKDALERAGIPFCYLDGSTKDRLGECNRFNRTPEIPVFLISLMAGGTGLNLTGADMVMHYDPWWNPAVEDQATDRAHRIGQKKTVYVMKMIASDTIEEKVLALQRRKQGVISATVDTTDAAVMEKLTAADIAELLS